MFEEVDIGNFSRLVQGDWAVYDSSPLFRGGVFPERIDARTGKVLEITEEDIQDMVKNFNEPVKGNLLHEDFLDDGRAGLITKIWNVGKDLFGSVSIPLWLDEHLYPKEKKISVEIDPTTLKSLIGFALVTNPRITGAQLMSAEEEYFAKKPRHDTYPGQSTMQRVHDIVAMSAICDEVDTQMSSKHEMKAAQAIHDMSVEHGASCAMSNYYSDNNSTCPFYRVVTSKEKKSMKFPDIFGKLGTLFTGRDDVPVEELVKAIDPEANVTTNMGSYALVGRSIDVTKTTEFQAKEKELADLRLAIEADRKELEDQRALQFKTDNEAKVDAYIAEKKFDPALRDKLIERRALSPVVFDEMAELTAVKSEYSFNGVSFETETELKAEILRRGLITGGDALEKTQGDSSAKEQFEATKKALMNLPGGMSL